MRLWTRRYGIDMEFLIIKTDNFDCITSLVMSNMGINMAFLFMLMANKISHQSSYLHGFGKIAARWGYNYGHWVSTPAWSYSSYLKYPLILSWHGKHILHLIDNVLEHCMIDHTNDEMICTLDVFLQVWSRKKISERLNDCTWQYLLTNDRLSCHFCPPYLLKINIAC